MCTRDSVLDFAERFSSSSLWLEGDIYVFGVFKGQSIAHFLTELDKRKRNFKRILGFDSFEGLPAEDPDVAIYDGHLEGAFKIEDPEGKLGLDDIVKCIGKLLRQYPNGEKVEIVKGFYDQTLTPALVTRLNLKPALFIDIDADLYISTRQLLEFMTENHLIVPGTILYYDDWGGIPEYTGGESLAHAVWVKNHGAVCELLCDTGLQNGVHRQKIFMVKEIGA